MVKEKYPQGLKKNPITVVSPNGKTVMKFNSYREAMDVLDEQGEQHMRYAFSPNGMGGPGDPYDRKVKQAEKEGYEELGPQLSAFAAKTLQGQQTIAARNEEWIAKTAGKKPDPNISVKKDDKFRRGMNIKK